MDVRGLEDISLGEHWSKHLETYLGITQEHYPNMFMLSAPQSPFANLPMVLDNAAAYVGEVIRYMEENGYQTMEPYQEAQEKWCKQLNDVYNATVLPKAALKAGSWYIGANVSQRPLYFLLTAVNKLTCCS